MKARPISLITTMMTIQETSEEEEGIVNDVNRHAHYNATVGRPQGSEVVDGLAKPKSVQGDLSHLPSELMPLIALPHWVCWRWEIAKDKFTKVPYQPNGRKAK